jgi:signal transduction histidine kinase
MVTRRDCTTDDGDSHRSTADIPVPVLIVDVNGDRIIDANPAAAALVSCTPHDLMALPLSRTLVGEGDNAELRVGDRSVAVHVIRPEGWHASNGPISVVLLDRLRLSLATLSENDLRSEADRMRRQLDEFQTQQERLVSVWAHELKTPLTVVQSYLEILTTDLDDGLSDEQLSFLRITKESVLRLRRLVLDLIDLVGFQSGHLNIETAPVDVSTLLDEVTGELQPLAKSAGIELIHERPAVRVAIQADADRVQQILRNLLDNAFKFTPENGRVTVRTRVERDWVIVDVVDSGVGIHEADVERIFREFVQVKRDGMRRRLRGSGLGLAISHRIAQAHGGAIEVVSELDMGSTFSVRLPREHVEEP